MVSETPSLTNSRAHVKRPYATLGRRAAAKRQPAVARPPQVEDPDSRVRSPEARAQVSNGSVVLPNVDGRSVVARRYRDITAAIVADQGGADNCAEARIQLIRRFSATAVIAEQIEARLAQGEPINVAEHALMCSVLARLASRIGIDRRAREIVPTLKGYLEESYSEDDEDEEESG